MKNEVLRSDFWSSFTISYEPPTKREGFSCALQVGGAENRKKQNIPAFITV